MSSSVQDYRRVFLLLKLQLKSEIQTHTDTQKKKGLGNHQLTKDFYKYSERNWVWMCCQSGARKVEHRMCWRGIHIGDGTASSRKDHGKALKPLNGRWRMNMRFLEVIYETNVPPCFPNLMQKGRQAVQCFLPGQKRKGPSLKKLKRKLENWERPLVCFFPG